ncbi:uncharacterized protein [Setaria viridis]|uniref:uncharacterized protein n=1 Tax=Setaria viridis TaxID=4556 RepID=UPI003B3B707B
MGTSQLATKSLLTHAACMTVTKLLGDARPSTRVQVPRDSKRLGRDLDRISRGLYTKLPIHVREGLKRPEAPMQDAKFSSEGGIILRGHIPILTQACTDMLKSQQRQGSYRLKKKYFNGLAANEVPTKTPVTTRNDDQWNKLVTMWSSQPYRREKQVEGDPTPIDIFKNFHCSKNGNTAPVQAAIASSDRTNHHQPRDDQPKTVAEAVAKVVQSRIFRKVAGIHPPSKKRTRVGTALQVEEIQADLESEKQGGTQL